MFARSALRATAPLKRNLRTYATGPAASSSNTALYAALGVVGAAGGYWYYANGLGKAPKIPKVPSPAAVQAQVTSMTTVGGTTGNTVPAAGSAAEKSENPVGPPADAKKAFTGGEQGFLSLKLEKVEDVNHNTKAFVFALPEEDMVSGLAVASALITKFKTDDMKKPVIRPYTPISDEDTKGTMTLMIKKYPGGPMSTHIFSMQPGSTLDIKGPIPKYPYTPNAHNHVCLIAGGTGITPMYQLARGIFKNGDDRTKVTLVFGNLTKEDILLKKEFDELENTYPRRFRAFYVLDNPPEGWEQGKGHITKDLLKTLLPEPKEEGVKVFVCGPPGLYKAISGAKKSPQDQGELDGYLKELGYSKDQVFKF